MRLNTNYKYRLNTNVQIKSDIKVKNRIAGFKIHGSTSIITWKLHFLVKNNANLVKFAVVIMDLPECAFPSTFAISS